MEGDAGGSSGFISALLFSSGFGVAVKTFEELNGLMRKAEGSLDRNKSNAREIATV
jgi:hypothetical protein